jgi:hypothetical protein
MSDQDFYSLQNWVEKLTAIFAGGDIRIDKDEIGSSKLPLFYVSDTLFGKWMLIQENWFSGILPDAFGKFLNYAGDKVEESSNEEEIELGSKKKKAISRKKMSRALKQNDLQPLFGLRDSEVEKMANLVIAKKISIKTTKSTTKEATLRGLPNLCQEEKKIRIIKNEMMFVFADHPLPSRIENYVLYPNAAYEAFAK